MSAETIQMSWEEMANRRKVMVRCAAGALALKNYNLRPDQAEALQKGLRFVIEGTANAEGPTLLGHYEEPTGYGKSVLETQHALALGLGRPEVEETIPGGFRGLTLTPTRYLRDQKAQTYAKFAPQIDFSTRPLERGTKRFPTMLGTTYSYARRALFRGEFYPGQFDVIYCDEAHHTLGAATLRAVQMLQRGAINIGLTPTPGYDEERTIAHTLPHVIDRTTLLEGILTKKFLSPVQLYSMRTGEYVLDQYDSGGRDYSVSAVEHLGASRERNQTILSAAMHGLETTKGKGIVKCIAGRDQAHAKEIAALLDGQPFPGTERSIRARAVGAFEKNTSQLIKEFSETNNIDVLTYIDVLGEGVDIPDLAWGVYGTPTRSRLNLTQFLGRGLRPKDTQLPFILYQVLDEVYGQPENFVHAWSLFGLDRKSEPGISHQVLDENSRQPESPVHVLNSFRLDREPEPGFIIAPDDADLKISAQSIRPPQTAMQTAAKPKGPILPRREILDHQNIQPNALAQMVLATEIIPPDDIHDVIEETGLDDDWLRRILIKEGFGILAIADEGAIKQYFPKEAEQFIANEVAGPEDKKINEVAAMLNVPVETLTDRLSTMGEDMNPTLKYQRNPGKRLQKLRHLSPSQIAILLPSKREKITDEQMGISEIAEILGKDVETTRSILRNRGFQQIKPKHKTQVPVKSLAIFHRNEVEPWAKTYRDAEPLPESGYRPLRGVIRECGATLAVAHPIVRTLGMPTPFFVTGRGRSEYIRLSDIPALEQAIAYYFAAQDSAESSTVPALHQQPQPEVFPWGQRVGQNQLTKDQKNEGVTEQVTKKDLMLVARGLRCSSHVIQFLISAHPAFKDDEIMTDNEGTAYLEESTNQKLYDLVTETTGQLSRSWVFAGAVVVKPDHYVHDLRKTHPEIKHDIRQTSLDVPGHGRLVLIHCLPEAYHAIKTTTRKDTEARRNANKDK